MPIDKGTTLPITQLSGLQINYKDSNSCFNLPIMTTTEREALINTNDPTNHIKNGTMIFNSDDNLVQYYQIKDGKGTWISVAKGAGTGDVVGPDSSTDNHIAVFDGTTGKIIKDGGPKVNPVVVDANSSLSDTPLYELSNLKILHFGDIDVPGSIDTATIMMDGFTPITFQTQKLFTGDEIICSVFNGQLGEGSSSPSAILEINSSLGGFLNSRMTTAERDALDSPSNGLTLFNTDTQKLTLRAGGTWIELGNGQGEGTVTSVGLINTDNNLTITGGPITSSGNIKINLSETMAALSLTLTSPSGSGNNGSYTLYVSKDLKNDLDFVFPSNSGTAGQVLSTDGKGNTSWINNGGGSGTVTSVGLVNTDQNIWISNSPITTSGNIQINLDTDPAFSSVALGKRNSGKGWILTIPSTLKEALTLTLPSNAGTAGQVLSTDGKGNTSWINNGGGGGGGAPTNSYYLLTQPDSSLPNATILPVLTSNITANGLYIGYNCGNTTAIQNAYYSLGVGNGTLYGLQSGYGNVALGYNALQVLQNGSYNIAIGQSALQLNYKSNSATDAPNLAIGYQSLMTAGASYGNIAIGHQTLQSVVSTQSNTVIGYQSMSTVSRDSTGSDYNTAVGYQTLYNIDGSTSSPYNTVIGYKAGSTYASYKNCTFIGANADASVNQLTNATALGFGAKVSKSNALVLGNSSTYVGLGGIASPNYSLHIGNINNTCAILLSATYNQPGIPTGQYDVCLWAKKGDKNGTLFFQSTTGGIYKVDSTSVSAPASEPKIPVLTAEEIQNLQEIALGAIVYDSTNDTVIISTKSGWQNLTRSLYDPQNGSGGI